MWCSWADNLRLLVSFLKPLDCNNCNVEFMCDTGVEVSIIHVTKTASDMLGLELPKPDCQPTSAEGSHLNKANVCNMHISKHSH